MKDNNNDWKSIPSSKKSLSKEEEMFISKYAKNKEKARAIANSLLGKTYSETKKRYHTNLSIDEIVGIDIVLKRCIGEKEDYYDVLMHDSIESFIYLVEAGRDDE